MPELKNVTDPNLPEPKGLSVALAGTVYVADGAGGASWDVMTAALSTNSVTVESIDDLPAAVSDVITLAADTYYLICCHLSIGGSRIVFSSNSIVQGLHRNLSSITTTNTSNLMSCSGVDMRIRNLRMVANSATNVLDFDGGGTATLRVVDSILPSVNDVGIKSTNAAALLIDFSLIIGGDKGLVCAGANNTSFFCTIMGIFGYATNGVDLGASLWDGMTLSDVSFSGLGGSFDITGLANSGNINAGNIATVDSCGFGGSGTHLQNIEVNDILWKFISNDDVPDSTADAMIYLDTNALSTTGTSTAGGVVINATTWAEEHADRMTTTTGGRVTYDGVQPLNDIGIHASVTAAGAAGSNEFEIYIAKNGTIIQASKVAATFPSTSEVNVSLFAIASAVQTDYFEIYVFQTGNIAFDCFDANIVVR